MRFDDTEEQGMNNAECCAYLEVIAKLVELQAKTVAEAAEIIRQAKPIKGDSEISESSGFCEQALFRAILAVADKCETLEECKDSVHRILRG